MKYVVTLKYGEQEDHFVANMAKREVVAWCEKTKKSVEKGSGIKVTYSIERAK